MKASVQVVSQPMEAKRFLSKAILSLDTEIAKNTPVMIEN
jgi:hypothetical protein